ncbi:hypothetical protein EYC84_007770 [Monilinia fructicola]|uniref:Uncharacterized protein n=1 Tax=Monilinia fructicola TaxID=38448 RepID=A0A5M9JHK5_MONFR|nr:hypothetical protein EYC84_007770 [Monilinia fructicola]
MSQIKTDERKTLIFFHLPSFVGATQSVRSLRRYFFATLQLSPCDNANRGRIIGGVKESEKSEMMSQEPYKKVGRGGAGNFYSKQDVERTSGASDLEAQSASSSAGSTKHHKTPSLISQALRAVSGPPPEYQHTGRGGAGNLASPASLLSSGLTQTTTNYSDPTVNPAPPSSSPRNIKSSMQSVVYKGGRGGAGNYDWEEDNKEKERISGEEKRKEEEIGKLVVGEVDGEGEGGLKKPGKAYDINAGKEMEGGKGGALGGVLE